MNGGTVIGDLLREFLSQAQTNDLKTARYPKVYRDFEMKVSFGQGVQARVPWISFLTPEMSTSNGYYPVYLYYKSTQTLILAFGISETNEYSKTWPEEVTASAPRIDDLIENPPRYGDSWIFQTYQVRPGPAIELKRGTLVITNEDLESDLNEILDIYSRSLDQTLTDKGSTIGAGLFYMEQQLEDFLIENWDSTELGQKFELIHEEGVLVSQQYQTAIGRIDILAKDKLNGDYVVIELKRNQTSDDTVGQVARYMGWVKEHFQTERVRGIIVCGKYDQRLQYARSVLPAVDVFIYQVHFELKEHKS